LPAPDITLQNLFSTTSNHLERGMLLPALSSHLDVLAVSPTTFCNSPGVNSAVEPYIVQACFTSFKVLNGIF
jgi:hypothetical protein